MNDWAAASRWSNWWMKFPSPNLQKRHGSSDALAPDYSTTWCLLKGVYSSWRRWSGERERRVKKKEKRNFQSPLFLIVAAADDVDQRKVTEGKMHIEKALGNIWCRRQSGLYHSSGEKNEMPRNMEAPPDTPMHVSPRRSSDQRCKPIWRVHLPPLSDGKWRLCTLMCSARFLLETLNKWPKRHDEQLVCARVSFPYFSPWFKLK